jgi:hypothetical protein
MMLDKMRPASFEAMAGRNVGMRFGAHPVNSQNSFPVQAQLTGSDTATALGITGRGNTPVLDLCRKLVRSGVDPNLRLDCYRGGTSCLHIRTIGEGAGLEINSHGTGFIALRDRRRGSPMSWNGGGLG